MRVSEIKSREELIKYIDDRQLQGLKAEDDTKEKLLELCVYYNVPKSMLRMHLDVCRK
ncbi:MAG: hypothetical protein RR313_05945 [Anaerovoracaceae bacterium]